MLLKHNYEVCQRTSLEYPSVHKNGGTIFIPKEIEEITIDVPQEDGTSVSEKGYKFQEYRINSAEDVPNDVSQALFDALSSLLDNINTIKESSASYIETEE